MKPGCVHATLCLIAAILLVAADARAHAVWLHSRCAGERLAALLEQLRVIQAEVHLLPSPVPSPNEIEQWLVKKAGGVVVIVDSECMAQVEGVHGEHYEVSAQLPTRAWAVRIAELAYALSPYDARPAAAESQTLEAGELEVAELDAPLRAWSVGLGPAMWGVSGAEGAMAALGAHLSWQARQYLAVTLNGMGSLSRTDVGPKASGALVRTVHVGLGPRLRLPLRGPLSVDLTLTYGMLWAHAEGRAQPPLGNRGDQTFASMGVVGLGGFYMPGSAWGVRLEASIGRALPTVRVVLGDEERRLAAIVASLCAALVFRF